jgi:branched-chain amino acid transport system permease protein
MFAPGGIASLIMMNLRVAKFGKFQRLWGIYGSLILTGAVMTVGAAAIVEMTYHMQLNSGMGSRLNFMGIALDTESAASWIGAAAVLAVGLALFSWVRKRFVQVWGRAQEEIEAEIKLRERAQ